MYNSVLWRIIARELARTGGVASQAARDLRGTSPAFKGLSTATLYPGLFTAEAQRTQCELMNLMPVKSNPPAVLCALCVSAVNNSGYKALAGALQAVPANNAPVEATSLLKLFGFYAKGIQTMLKK
jgi:hypothetical protein